MDRRTRKLYKVMSQSSHFKFRKTSKFILPLDLGLDLKVLQVLAWLPDYGLDNTNVEIGQHFQHQNKTLARTHLSYSCALLHTFKLKSLRTACNPKTAAATPLRVASKSNSIPSPLSAPEIFVDSPSVTIQGKYERKVSRMSSTNNENPKPNMVQEAKVEVEPPFVSSIQDSTNSLTSKLPPTDNPTESKDDSAPPPHEPVKSASSIDTPLEVFTLFPKLPAEMRYKIVHGSVTYINAAIDTLYISANYGERLNITTESMSALVAMSCLKKLANLACEYNEVKDGSKELPETISNFFPSLRSIIVSIADLNWADFVQKELERPIGKVVLENPRVPVTYSIPHVDRRLARGVAEARRLFLNPARNNLAECYTTHVFRGGKLMGHSNV
ncbi:hypothetical protein IFR05_013780 [Cadophora sp. M221]|nr:hypothetical protein IFR05_013780 [Cadophora sp. M221]